MSELIFVGQTRAQVIKEAMHYMLPISKEQIKEIEDKVRLTYPADQYDVFIGDTDFGGPKIPIKVVKK